MNYLALVKTIILLGIAVGICVAAATFPIVSAILNITFLVGVFTIAGLISYDIFNKGEDDVA